MVLLVVLNERRSADKCSCIFDAEVRGNRELELRGAFNNARVVGSLKFNCAENQVFISSSDAGT